MSKPTLLILAAGLGSRYGSVKQMDKLGRNGEAIIDYSIFDAYRAGFRKVVFVIRKNFENDFNEAIINKLPPEIETSCVFQEIDNIPEGFSCPSERIKPWGTGHAVMTAAKEINDPFIVINADDFYGYGAYKTAANFINSVKDQKSLYSLIGYKLKNTLSDYGFVSRGICSSDENNLMESIVERTHIKKENGEIFFEENDLKHSLTGEEIVSMNMLAFTPDIFKHFDFYFRNFLNNNSQNSKAEFYLPSVVNNLIEEDKAKVKILETDETWFGLTYKEDKQAAKEKIQNLIDQEVYPTKLWK